MGQEFQIDVFNNTRLALNLQVENVSMGGGDFDTWPLPPQASLSEVASGAPSYQIDDGQTTGAISVLVQLAIGGAFQQVAQVNFDSTALTDFTQGVIFYENNVSISPGVPVPESGNFLFATLHLGFADTSPVTAGTVVILEAVGATSDLP